MLQKGLTDVLWTLTLATLERDAAIIQPGSLAVP